MLALGNVIIDINYFSGWQPVYIVLFPDLQYTVFVNSHGVVFRLSCFQDPSKNFR